MVGIAPMAVEEVRRASWRKRVLNRLWEEGRRILGQKESQGLPRPQPLLCLVKRGVRDSPGHRWTDRGTVHSRQGLAKHGEPLPIGGCSPTFFANPSGPSPVGLPATA